MIDLPEGSPRNSKAGREFRKQYRTLRRTIGGNIERIRKSQDMALKVLARRTGMSAERLNYWEEGRMEIPLSGILRVAATLGVSHLVLLGTGPEDADTENTETEIAEPKAKKKKKRVYHNDFEVQIYKGVRRRLKNPEGLPDSDALLTMEEPVQRTMRSAVLFCDLARGAMKDDPPNASGLWFLATSMRREAERLYQLYYGNYPQY